MLTYQLQTRVQCNKLRLFCNALSGAFIATLPWEYAASICTAESLKRILNFYDVSRRLARCQFWSSKLDFDVMDHTVVKD